MTYKIPDELINQISVLDNNDFLVKQRAEELNVSQGWDDIPTGFVGASIMCYRGPHIFYFQVKLPDFDGQQNLYQVVTLADFKDHPGLEEVAWDLADIQGAEPRVAGALYGLN